MDKKAQGMNTVVKWIALFIGLVILAVIISRLLWSSGSEVKGLTACNNNFNKCACLLYSEGATVADIECPSGSIQSDYSKSCPKKCSADTFEDNLKDAQKDFKESKSKRDSFGHCCRGDFADWEAVE